MYINLNHLKPAANFSISLLTEVRGVFCWGLPDARATTPGLRQRRIQTLGGVPQPAGATLWQNSTTEEILRDYTDLTEENWTTHSLTVAERNRRVWHTKCESAEWYTHQLKHSTCTQRHSDKRKHSTWTIFSWTIYFYGDKYCPLQSKPSDWFMSLATVLNHEWKIPGWKHCCRVARLIKSCTYIQILGFFKCPNQLFMSNF